MSKSPATDLPDLGLSHFELFVHDLRVMEDFYTRHLGFEVSDRGAGDSGMVFMTRNPAEHHQLVLNPVTAAETFSSPVDHISFRVGSLAHLRKFYASLLQGNTDLQTVSHGNTWSIYFRDPEANRLELFADTPWQVNQPCRFEIDLRLDDTALAEFTERSIKNRPGFRRSG